MMGKQIPNLNAAHSVECEAGLHYTSARSWTVTLSGEGGL
jgi:hypothetical protein